MLDDRFDWSKRLPVAQVQPRVRRHGAGDHPAELRPHQGHARRVERVQIRHEVQPDLDVPIAVHRIQGVQILRQVRPGGEAPHELDVPQIHVVVHRVHHQLRVHPLLLRVKNTTSVHSSNRGSIRK